MPMQTSHIDLNTLNGTGYKKKKKKEATRDSYIDHERDYSIDMTLHIPK